MKELSIEEKAKRYDDRLEKARKWYDANTNEGYKGIFEDIFPELKESEERIGKAIIKHFRQGTYYTSFYGFSKDEIIAWLEKHIGLAFHFHQLEEYIMQLEKQGEQKSLDDITKEVTKDKNTAISFLKSTGIINENGELADEYKIEKGEQKPAEWSEEDEKVLHAIRNALNYEKPRNYLKSRNFEFTDILDWLRSLKDRVQTKPKQEWSEEDESLRRRCIGAIDMANLSDYTKDSLLNWLKSLRPQNNATDEELAQARKDAYNDALDKIEYHSGEPTFDDGWSAAIWYLKKRNAQPQNTWKPSDEHMVVLNDIIINEHLSNTNERILKDLQEQLKKLREE